MESQQHVRLKIREIEDIPGITDGGPTVNMLRHFRELLCEHTFYSPVGSTGYQLDPFTIKWSGSSILVMEYLITPCLAGNTHGKQVKLLIHCYKNGIL
jgi:hypothetical protein